MPAKNSRVYGLAQAVRAGKSDAMPKKVAKEMIEATPPATRSRFQKQIAKRNKK